MASKRTDLHSPGNIVPEDYDHVLFYALSTTARGWPIPGINIDEVRRLRTERRFAATGGIGQCSVCGARYKGGSVWEHVPTGVLIHIGDDCALKYELLMDRVEVAEFADMRASVRLKALHAQRVAVRAEQQAKVAAQAAVSAAAVLAADPDLAAAMAVWEQSTVIASIKDAFAKHGRISEPQKRLVKSLASQLIRKAAEVHIPAVITLGRQTVTGPVVSTRCDDTDYGPAYKMLIEISGAGGTWLAWGTIPASMLEGVDAFVPSCAAGRVAALRGCRVQVTASFTTGREPHFAFFKRPTGLVLAGPQ